MSFVKGQKCFITINPWSKQGAECRQYFETREEVILDELLDNDMYYVYIRNAVIAKVSPKYYTIRYEYAPDGGYWVQDVKILKDDPYYEKDKQYCCLSKTYEEASNKLWEAFEKDGDYNV